MYYWDYRGIYLILTDQEEMGLVRKLSGGNFEESIAYNTSKKTRRKYERMINKYLKAQFRDDLEGFHKQFVFRCWHNDEAQQMFPRFLDAYERSTRVATVGHWKEAEIGEELVERLVHGTTEDLVYVSLLNRPRFSWLGFRVVGVLSFPRSEILTVTGTVDNFAVIARSFHIRFGRTAVRILLQKDEYV
jgi:hypothetical protein